MKIGGDYRVYPWHNTWPGAAKDLGIDPEQLVARVDDLAASAPDAFSEAASTDDVTSLHRELPDKLVSLIADRSHRCRVALQSSSAS